MQKAAQAYFQTKVSTTDQGHLLIMLYDGALNYLQQAREKILAKDYAGKGILISKVIDIVSELSGSLNLERGGSLATNLSNLYILCTARLLQANLKLDLEALDSVVHILSGLRSAYAQIIDTPDARKAAQQISSRMQPVGASYRAAKPVVASQAMPTAVPRSMASAAYGRSMAAAQIQAQVQGNAPQTGAGDDQERTAHIQAFAPQGGRLPGAYSKAGS